MNQTPRNVILLIPLVVCLLSPLASRADDAQRDSTVDGPDLVLEHPVASVRVAIFDPDGKRVATAARDGRVRIWDAGTGKLLHTLVGSAHGDESDDRLLEIIFSADGSHLAGLSEDEHTYLWDPAAGRQVAAICGRKWRHSVVQFSPDGQRLLLVEHGCAYVHEAATGRRVRVLQGDADGEDDDADWVESATFGPKGRFIVTTIEQGAVTLWDTGTLKKLRALSSSEGRISFVGFWPDGRRFVTLRGEHAQIWDTDSENELADIPVGPRGGSRWWFLVAFSFDGSHMLTSNSQRTALLWDAETGKRIARLEGHADLIVSLLFSPDGKHILTRSKDHAVRLWEAPTGKLIAELDGHTKSVNSALFSPDGKYVLTASNDQTARLWDGASGEPHRILQHEAKVYFARFSPDGKRILTASKDGAARVWSVAER